MAGEDRRYLEWVRTLPCCVPGCWADSQAHHRTVEGTSVKSHDHEAMPLCAVHHENFHKLSGPFKGWRKDRIRAWQLEMVAHTQARSWLNTAVDAF